MDLVIVGAGGFGREVLDVVKAVNSCAREPEEPWRFVGFIDDGSPDMEGLNRIDALHLGGTENLRKYAGASYVVGVGSPGVRAVLAEEAEASGLVAANCLIHPSATIGADVIIGRGSVVTAGVRITTNVRVGRHVHLNLNVTVGHDAVLEDFVTVNPLAAISGDVVLRARSTVGTTACINQGLQVGAGAVVGSGAAVVKDVAPATTVVGVPARALGG